MSLGKTKEFYNLLRAQFIKEISEDHEISKILSSDTIERLDKIWQQKLEQSGVYHPNSNEQPRNLYAPHIQPNTSYNMFNTSRINMQPPPQFNPRLDAHRPSPLLNKAPATMKEFQEKIEEPTEVKQEYKSETEHITNSNEPTKKSESIINVQPIKKPSKIDDDDEDEEEFKNSDTKKDKDEDDEDLFRGEDDVKPTEPAQEAEDADDKRRPPPVEEYSPLGSEDSIEDNDIVDTTDMIVGYHEKVHRHGTKWKVNLKHCIMNLKGKEYILSTVTGEFDF